MAFKEPASVRYETIKRIVKYINMHIKITLGFIKQKYIFRIF